MSCGVSSDPIFHKEYICLCVELIGRVTIFNPIGFAKRIVQLFDVTFRNDCVIFKDAEVIGDNEN